jgi:hypothetical protein
VVGAFPDGHSALMLVAARLRHIASAKWGKRRYLVMETLTQPCETGGSALKIRSRKSNVPLFTCHVTRPHASGKPQRHYRA